MKPNIIFIHKGNSWYLHLALLQAKKSNPDANICLIGTKETKHLNSIVKHYNIDNYSESASALPDYYIHYSTNTQDFELFCIGRWFVLAEFMKKQQLESCIYMDSDILIYKDLEWWSTDVFSDCELAFSGFSPHTTFVNNATVLSELCQFILELYKEEASTKILQKKYKKFIAENGAGGISDMTFFYEFRMKYPEKYTSTIEAHLDTTFDITIDTTDGYESENGIKSLAWLEGYKPVGFTSDGKNAHYFITLHFQGKYKKLMFDYSKPKTLKFRLQHIYYLLYYKIQKAALKLTRPL